MSDTENKFLQKVDLEALQKETGLSLEELAKLAEIGPKVIYKWRYTHKDSSRPSYNAIVKLLLAGATTKTLFGVDCNNGGPKPPDTPELRAGQQQALKDIEATIAARVKNEILTDLKNKGVI